MVDSDLFNPTWVSPPGDTITTILSSRGLTKQQFARSISRSADDVDTLLQGKAELTKEVARQLAAVLGSTEDFWLNREQQYRRALERLRHECSRPDSLEWLSELPAKEMMHLRWIEPATDKVDAVAQCLRFFGVPSVACWREEYEKPLGAVAFRTSEAFTSHPGAVMAWLRQGEVLASQIRCSSWNRRQFQDELGNLRALTRVTNPDDFLPELKQRCAASGVAVVLLRAPKMCRASGACCFLSPTRPMLLLSGRHLTDDHFWFTFFHEAGHAVLHSEKRMFIDALDDEGIPAIEENEANEFAENTLIPPDRKEELLALAPTVRAIARFARQIGVSPGIVVGQLQHYGILRHDQLYGLKQRYDWR